MAIRETVRATAAAHDAGEPRRTDIDALRALGIIAVVLFHAHLLPGGFIGVDILFVISGYLMAVIVGRMFDRDRFSVIAFYARRVRRIVPALVVVLVVVAVIGSLVLLPDDLHDLGRSMVATAAFTANLYFRAQATDYFLADNVVYQPLLHCWSLAVEAQFYVLFPLLVLAARRLFGRAAGLALAVVALCSFGYSAYAVAADPQAAFYLLPSRMWQLLAGAMVYHVPPHFEARLSRSARAGLAALGALLLVVALAAFSPGIGFPGFNALLPVAGTGLIVLSRPGTVSCLPRLAPLLATRLVAFPANISYSLYLWHWPLFVFARYLHGPELPLWLTGAVVAVSVGLSWMSWRWVERPFLKRQSDLGAGEQKPQARATENSLAARRLPPATGSRFSARRFGACRQFAAPVAMLLVLLAAGLLTRDVLPKQNRLLLPRQVAALADAGNDYVRGECTPSDSPAAPPCRPGAADAPPHVLLWGNSFARMWLPAFDALGNESDRAAVAAIRSACSPAYQGGNDAACRQFNAETLQFALNRQELRTVVLSANWASPDETATALAGIVAALHEKGKRVFLVLKPPFPGYRVPHTLALAALRGAASPELEPTARHVGERDRYLAALQPLVARYGLRIIDPTALFCDGDVCHIQDKDGTVLYYDMAHLTRAAALKFRALFTPVFEQ